MTIPLRPFGRTGVKVSALALGTMMFGSRGNQPRNFLRTSSWRESRRPAMDP